MYTIPCGKAVWIKVVPMLIDTPNQVICNPYVQRCPCSIGQNIYIILHAFHWSQRKTDCHGPKGPRNDILFCHREERSDVAIRSPFGFYGLPQALRAFAMTKKGGADCHGPKGPRNDKFPT